MSECMMTSNEWQCNCAYSFISSATGAVCMTRRKTWHTVCLGREQARRSRGRSGRLRAVGDVRKRLHGASRPDITWSGVGHGAIPLCESASAMPERKRRNGGCSLAFPVRPRRMCAQRRCSAAPAARNRSGAHFRRGGSGQYEGQGEALPCSRRLFLKSRACSKA